MQLKRILQKSRKVRQSVPKHTLKLVSSHRNSMNISAGKVMCTTG